MRTVQPCYVEIEHNGFSPNLDIMDWQVVAGLWLCHFGYFKSTLHIMPAFTPNEYMLDNFSHMGDEDWQIFAWCVRDAIAV